MTRNELLSTLLGGAVGTIALLLFSSWAAFAGLYQNPPLFMQEAANYSMWLGLLLHFAIGWLWAFLYFFVFCKVLEWIPSFWLRGGVYGLLVAILLRIIFSMTNALIVTTDMSQHIITLMIGYVAYGTILGLFVHRRFEK